jgi:hypothetical protein
MFLCQNQLAAGHRALYWLIQCAPASPGYFFFGIPGHGARQWAGEFRTSGAMGGASLRDSGTVSKMLLN